MLTLSKFLSKLSSNIQPTIFYSRKCKFSSTAFKSPVLTRDFIYDRLYNPKGGYFCKDDLVVGELTEPIEFQNMSSEDAYTRELVAKYPKNAWLTPTELFKPWYGMTIGNYIHKAFQEALKNSSNLQAKPKIKIIEVGAGTGSAAEGILKFFKGSQPKEYENLQYKIVELSPHMCKRARENLQKEHKALLDKGHVDILNQDFLSYNQKDNELTFVLLFEVLDDMPHDRVYYSQSKNEWHYETWVEFDDQDGNKNLRETKKPISDSLIREAVDLLNSMPESESVLTRKHKSKISERAIELIMHKKGSQNIFLPTSALKMLKTVKENLPAHHLIIADFNMLGTNAHKHGINSPVVSKKLEKYFDKKVFDSYLVNRGEADIFFPTDFHYLRHAYRQICGKNAELHRTHQFMDNFASTKWAELQNGYNLLKEDYSNTSILTTSWKDTFYDR